MSEIIKIAGLEYTADELYDKYFVKRTRYIVKYSTVYALDFCENLIGCKIYARKIYTETRPHHNLMKRGRHLFIDAENLNKLLGFKLVRE